LQPPGYHKTAITMSIKPLTLLQGKLLRIVLDKEAPQGEALAALAKLQQSLERERRSPHDVADLLEGVVQAGTPPIAPPRQGPDYSRCIIPFGPNKGKTFAQVGPDQLLGVLNWVHWKFGADCGRFKDLVHNIERYLDL
jgi:hypothetical protein